MPAKYGLTPEHVGNVSVGPRRLLDVTGWRMFVVGAVASALLVTAGCAESRGSADPTASVTGVVLSGPRCPGPERIASPCPPGPVDGAAVAAVAGGHVIASTRTDSRGRFRLSLPPATYLLRATNVGAYRSTATQTVKVRIGHRVSVTLVVDTGIR